MKFEIIQLYNFVVIFKFLNKFNVENINHNNDDITVLFSIRNTESLINLSKNQKISLKKYKKIRKQFYLLKLIY